MRCPHHAEIRTLKKMLSLMLRDSSYCMQVHHNEGRPKIGKGQECIKCKMKHCYPFRKECFFPIIAAKFRRSLEPSINPVPDGPRRKALRHLEIFWWGVLLDLVYQSYLSTQELPITDDTQKPKGRKDHPRHLSVWPQAAVCYVETCSAFQGVSS